MEKEQKYSGVTGIAAKAEGKKLIYCPVWLMCQKKNGRTAYAAVNGRNGKVIADFPIYTPKFLALAAVLAVIAFLLLNFALSLRPEPAFWVTLSLMLIGLITCITQEKKAQKISDYTGVPMTGISFDSLKTNCILLAAAAVIVILSTRNNLLIYLTSLALAAAFTLCCVHTFRIHKQISSRRQPHFARKGADDRA